MQKITQENEFSRKNSATARFLYRNRQGHWLYVIIWRTGTQGCAPVFIMQKRRFCKTQLAKLCKIMQKNAKICRKICIYQKKVVILQRVSEESRSEPQKVNQ